MTQSCKVWPSHSQQLCYKVLQVALQRSILVHSSVERYGLCMAHSVQVFLAMEHHIALYLQYRGQEWESKAAVEEAVNTLGWVHSLAWLKSPTTSLFVLTTLEGLKRMLARPVTKKELVTPEMLLELVKDVNKDPSLSNICLATACLLAFTAILWFDELLHIRQCDIKISSEMAIIQILCSKNRSVKKGCMQRWLCPGPPYLLAQ